MKKLTPKSTEEFGDMGSNMRFFIGLVLSVCVFGFLTSRLLADDCPNGSASVNIATGQDMDGDGNDDNWLLLQADGTTFAPAPIGLPVFGWRGNLGESGPFNAGFRYPVLGEGRWLRPPFSSSTYTYQLSFTLDDCPNPTLSGEWDADNAIEILLNGNSLGIASNPNATPPLPWLANNDGIANGRADPIDGLVHPCDPPPYHCNSEVDEFREIHFFEITDPALFNLNGQNLLEIRVMNIGSVSGLLITGGADTSVLSGASVRCCPPERPPGAAVPADISIIKTASQTQVNPGANFFYSMTITNHGPGLATGVTVTDSLPPGLNLLSVTPSSPACSESNGTILCVLGQMEPGETAAITLEVAVDPTTLGVLTNIATVVGSHPESDPDPTPNIASVDVTVVSAIPAMNRYGIIILLLGLVSIALFLMFRRKHA